MKVKALQNILYNGAVYSKNTVFEMDECTAAISSKYSKIEVLNGGGVAEEIEEGDDVKGLPPVKKKK